MTLEWAQTILALHWGSFIFLGAVFGFYLYLELPYKNEYAEGLLVAFISRSFLQIISIFGYQDKRFAIAITGFGVLMWVAIMANRKLKSKINSIERTIL